MFLYFFIMLATGCVTRADAEVPPGGWANVAPTMVDQVVERGERQLLAVRQGPLRTWVLVPDVGAAVGDYVLLGRGAARLDVEIPELRQRASEVIDISHVRVVDEETARRLVSSEAPEGAVDVQTVYDELDQRAGREIVVYGVAVKVTSAVGSVWVHLQDGTGDAADGTNDLTVRTSQLVPRGQRVAFRGVLRRDVELGFGYRYDALVEEASLIE